MRAGEIVGLAGLVGAGRTELARVLFGLTPADAGRFGCRGKPVAIDSPAEAVELGIAYVPEDRRRHGVILDMPVAANTTLAILRAHFRRRAARLSPRAHAGAGRIVERLAIKTPSIDPPVGQLVRRQSAEGRARALAGDRAGGADPRRADAGHRRRREGRDPPADGRPGRPRHGDPDDLVRAARDSGHERSDRRDARRRDRRHADRAEATQEKVLSLALGTRQRSSLRSGRMIAATDASFRSPLAYGRSCSSAAGGVAPRFFPGDQFRTDPRQQARRCWSPPSA